jgi:hypothetical protein
MDRTSVPKVCTGKQRQNTTIKGLFQPDPTRVETKFVTGRFYVETFEIDETNYSNRCSF